MRPGHFLRQAKYCFSSVQSSSRQIPSKSIMQRGFMAACNSTLFCKSPLGGGVSRPNVFPRQTLNYVSSEVKTLDSCKTSTKGFARMSINVNNVLYRCFWSCMTRRTYESNKYGMESGLMNSQSLCSSPCTARAAHESSFDGSSVTEVQLHNSTSYDQYELILCFVIIFSY